MTKEHFAARMLQIAFITIRNYNIQKSDVVVLYNSFLNISDKVKDLEAACITADIHATKDRQEFTDEYVLEMFKNFGLIVG